ncbi:hypothetical protein [Shinella sp. JR1-6]|uniref:hypothetical protein n=1 Tax=Shinella sp. JR1-6 TaxID=2527671 RepID=UPI00102D4C24|nr:hypothetical protein [Shinella sp. JR1-6]TAA61628.1 hypothetical protein EXZ48_10790 [Shinella sp. JR1-6]
MHALPPDCIELPKEDDDALTVSEVIAAYDALLEEIAQNDRAVINLLLRNPNLTAEERAAIGAWGARLEELVSHFMLQNFSATGVTQ